MMKNPKKVVIFGANGAIGHALSSHYASAGADVVAITREVHDFDHQNITNLVIDYYDAQNFDALFLGGAPDIIITALGALCIEEKMPEKSLRDISEKYMEELYRINTVVPTLIIKHVLACMPRDHTFIFGTLSARVGSISDNHLGGWYSYRASKAALNMIIKTAAIEVGRKNKHAVMVGVHPGTVDSKLSKPFQNNVPHEKLFTPEQSAQYLANVIAGLTTEHSGKVLDWKGECIDP